MGNKHAGERTGAEELEKKSQRERITAHDTQVRPSANFHRPCL